MSYTNALPIYHIAFDGQDQKNFTGFYEMLELVKKGTLTKDTYVWKCGFEKWIKAGKVSELKPLFESPPDSMELFPEDFEMPD